MVNDEESEILRRYLGRSLDDTLRKVRSTWLERCNFKPKKENKNDTRVL